MSDFIKIKDFNYKPYYKEVLGILELVDKEEDLNWTKFRKILSKYPKDGNKYFSKEELVSSFYQIKKNSPQLVSQDPNFIEKIRMKPIRSQSGVTVVTVLTKPFPCPGQCIFCPNDIRMPKSYLSNEPGAQRAEMNNFDPYLQTYRRLKALNSIGHSLDKIEVIILGGTWSFYPESYQIWFIKRVFEALNDFGEGIDQTFEVEIKTKKPIIPKHFDQNFLSKKMGVESFLESENLAGKPPLATQEDTSQRGENSPNFYQEVEIKNNSKLEKDQKTLQEFVLNAEEITKLSKSSYNTAVTKIIKSTGNKLIKAIESASWEELEKEQVRNENTKCRCVGLVIETRPDKIDPQEVIRIRRLGCTKTQIGFQSLQDDVLDLNKRGHKVSQTRYAVKLLRQAGFKIHAHWMPNLYGSTPEKDIQDYQKMFVEIDFKPDELKIYPCSLIETADLMEYYNKGLWKPYSYEELLKVLLETIKSTPEYCRLTRIIRDIPGTDIVIGNKITNFRQVVELEMDKQGLVRKDIRSREIKNQQVSLEDLQLSILPYQSQVATELFLQFETRTSPLTPSQEWENRDLDRPSKIAGFLRLSLPNIIAKKFNQKIIETDLENLSEDLKDLFETKSNGFKHQFLEELDDSAIIREVHVYGKVVQIGSNQDGRAQHLGLGKKLIQKAVEIAGFLNYSKLAVISAIGTREYYQKQGFERNNGLYQVKNLIKK